MLREYATELKNYNFYEEFKKGYYLDAFDEHRWKVAQIRDISKYGLRTTIEVRFDGYSSRFDSVPPPPRRSTTCPPRTNSPPSAPIPSPTPASPTTSPSDNNSPRSCRTTCANSPAPPTAWTN